MTIQERLRTIGQAIRGKRDTQVVEVIKEVEKEAKSKAKSITGGFLDFSSKALVDETTVSSKVLEANKGWVYRNNDVIAKEVGNIEFELYRVRTVRDEIIYDRIFSHPLLDALDKFNEFTSSYDGFYTTQSHRKLAGDAFWYVDRVGLQINNIFILPPDKVEINLGRAEGSQRIIQSYTYKDTVKGEQIEITYSPDEVIHFRVPDPKNPYRGMSAVVAAAEAIDTDTMAIEANKKLFERGLIAQLMLTTEKSLTDAQLKQLHSEFKNTYGGVDNAYKVPIFGGGIKPENVQMSNKDAQFLEQQEWLRDKIMVIFGNNKAVLGITNDVNRSNAEATILDWKRTTVRPDMKGICDTLNEFLVPLYGDNLLLGFCDPVEEDEAEKIEEVKTLVASDIISINEAREELGRDPVDGGDELSFQRTDRRIQEAPQPPALRYVRTDRVLRKHQESVAQYKRIKEMVRPYAEKLVKGKKVEKRFDADKVKNYYEKQISIVETAELAFQDRVESFINKLVDKALEAVPNEIQDMQKKALFNEEDVVVQATIDFAPLLMEVAAQAGTEALALINSDKPYNSINLRAEIEQRVKLFAQSMVDTDKNKLIDMITQGIQDGKSIPDISRGIRDEFNAYSKMQAERITRTEVLRASNMSAVDAWEQSGEVVGKQWLISPGADPECTIYDGKIVKLKGNFYSTSEFADGDPPIHPNCRCTILPVLKGEMAQTDKVRIKQLEAEIDELVPKLKETEAVDKVQAKLEALEKREQKHLSKIKKLEQEKSELEGFLDES